jgi:glycosyltransferase involved in cell wall biosynthesis
MKIALIHYSAPPIVGGVETVLARQAQQFERAGHSVVVLAGRGQQWHARIPVTVIPQMDSRHPQVLKLRAALDAGQVPPEFDAFSAQLEADLRAALAGAGAVVLHNVASLPMNLALTAALYRISQSPGAPVFLLWHHDLAWTAERYAGQLSPGYPWDLLRTAWPGARQVVVSETRREELAGLMHIDPRGVAVVPAGLDLPEFLALPPTLLPILTHTHLDQRAPILLAPVRIVRRKNLELAITTLAALRAHLPDAVLVITGPPGAHNPANSGYLRELQQLRATLRLENAVYLMAEFAPEGLPDADVAALYRLADALFLPSRDEGFGIPLLEAGLAYLPMFCSDIPALRALAGDSALYFSPDADPLALAALVRDRLQSDPIYRHRARVRQNYTWEAVYQKQIAPLLEGRNLITNEDE